MADNDSIIEARKSIERFLNARTWTEAKQVIRVSLQQVSTESGRQAFNRLLHEHSTEGPHNAVLAGLAIIDSCRRPGMEETFRDLDGAPLSSMVALSKLRPDSQPSEYEAIRRDFPEPFIEDAADTVEDEIRSAVIDFLNCREDSTALAMLHNRAALFRSKEALAAFDLVMRAYADSVDLSVIDYTTARKHVVERFAAGHDDPF
jgi:hypothetical protein